jgi:putative ABC transport system substrate-binding protein
MKIGRRYEVTGKRPKVLGFALCAMLVALSFPAHAQEAKNVPRIGMVLSGSLSSDRSRNDAFRQGLHELGYVEGQNIVIEYRHAGENLDRVPALVAELARLKVDVIVVQGTVPALAAKQHTSTIPIVMAHVGDPVARGIIVSLAHPGGNITGLTSASPDLSGKRLELFKETVPRLTRVGVFCSPASQGATANFRETEAAARTLGVQIQSLEVRSSNDFESAFKAATGKRAGGLIVVEFAGISAYSRRIVEFATKSRLPTMFARGAHVESGGLMYYGPNFPDLYRRAATYVDKILKGSKPADLPVEQPTKFEFIINLKAAKQIGLTIPPNVLARADRIL